jgi:2-amino-4-hydroxy-6-hydroxymethyldihydropteridine diphosphokinase
MPAIESEAQEVYIAFGSNVGDQRANLRKALEALSEHGRILGCSALYATEPVGYLDQGWFLNGVARVATMLQPREMLAQLHAIELSLGRERRIRNGPRTIDLDILYWGRTVMDEAGLSIPHPRAHERLFVVAPWSDLAPDLVLPAADGKTLAQLRVELAGTSEVVLHCPAPW